MEVLIPVVALGGLAMSMKDSSSGNNANNKHNKEGYANIKQVSGIPSSYPKGKHVKNVTKIIRLVVNQK